MKQILLIISSLFLTGKIACSQIVVDTIPVNAPGKGLKALYVEKITPSASAIAAGVPSGSITYRLFVKMEPDYEFLGCTGYDNTNPLTYITIRSTEPFYNETSFGGASGASANPALFGVFPALEFDTYAADGRIGTSYVGVLKSVNPNGYIAINANSTPAGDISIPKPIAILTNPAATELYDYNSGWIVAGAVGGPDEILNTVFIGQLTTPGELTMELNISLQNPYGQIRYIPGIKYPLPIPPSVELTSPADGSTFVAGSTINIQATASDEDGSIDSVTFYVNNTRIGNDITEPYQVEWIPDANGTYSLITVATDNSGLSDSDTITVIIDNTIPPVISISNPVTGEVFFPNDLVILAANASDDGSIDSVEFYVNNIKVNTDPTAPYEYSWTALLGNATITAKAYDNDGLSTTSNPVEILVKNPVLPTINISSPANGATIVAGSIINIQASATDEDGSIDSVVFYVNNNRIGIDITEPYQIEYIPDVIGTYSIIAVAKDNDGLSGSDTITVYANNIIPPVISITSPVEGAVFLNYDPVSITANATDDGTIDSVEFYINDLKVNTDYIHPYQFTWTAALGNPSITAKAYDNEGANTTSLPVTILVKNAVAPVINIETPEAGATFIAGDTIIISGSSSDADGTIDSVELYIDGQKLAVTTESSFSFTWIGVTGDHTIRVIATDNDQLSMPDLIDIDVVANIAPSITLLSPADGAEIIYGNAVTIEANANDVDGSVAFVKFYISNSLHYTDSLAPYSFSWQADTGSFVIKAVATDNRGFAGAADSVSVSVIDVNIAPEVSILTPENNAVILPVFALTISVSATDDDRIDSVEIYLNSSKLGVIYEEPYEIDWMAILGSYTITVYAYDNDGIMSEATANFIVSTGEGIHNHELEFVNIFPNPVEEMLTIDLSGIKTIVNQISIYDLAGNKILEKSKNFNVNMLNLDVSGFKQGVYLLVLATDETIMKYKVIKK
ncbi:MAG: T9SS type A sorting domain-containing protein [Bacteroidales bacterium]|nr:T9SS type A sorting domain-containing protein [Bacteroidales bacterium]